MVRGYTYFCHFVLLKNFLGLLCRLFHPSVHPKDTNCSCLIIWANITRHHSYLFYMIYDYLSIHCILQVKFTIDLAVLYCSGVMNLENIKKKRFKINYYVLRWYYQLFGADHIFKWLLLITKYKSQVWFWYVILF